MEGYETNRLCKIKQECRGLLMLNETRNEQREAFTPTKLNLAQGIADQTAVAIRRMLLQE